MWTFKPQHLEVGYFLRTSSDFIGETSNLAVGVAQNPRLLLAKLISEDFLSFTSKALNFSGRAQTWIKIDIWQPYSLWSLTFTNSANFEADTDLRFCHLPSSPPMTTYHGQLFFFFTISQSPFHYWSNMAKIKALFLIW